MARSANNPTELMKWRLNQLPTKRFAENTGLPQSSIYKIERGEKVSRELANKYLAFWGAKIADRATFPPGLEIIDEGWSVRIQYQLQKTE